jgi:hypothetical protein
VMMDQAIGDGQDDRATAGASGFDFVGTRQDRLPSERTWAKLGVS